MLGCLALHFKGTVSYDIERWGFEDDVFPYWIGSYLEFGSCDRDCLELANGGLIEEISILEIIIFDALFRFQAICFFGKVPFGDDSTSICSYDGLDHWNQQGNLCWWYFLGCIVHISNWTLFYFSLLGYFSGVIFIYTDGIYNIYISTYMYIYIHTRVKDCRRRKLNVGLKSGSLLSARSFMLHLPHALPGSSLGWWSSRFSGGLWLLQCRGLVALIRWGPWSLGCFFLEEFGWKVRNVRNARNNKTPTRGELFFLEGWWRTVYSFGEVALETLNEGSLFCVVRPVCKCRVVPDYAPNSGWDFNFHQKTNQVCELEVSESCQSTELKIQHESGHDYQLANHLNDIMTSTHRNPFLFHHGIFPLNKNQCVGVCPKSRPSFRPTKNSLHLNR